MSEIRKPSPFYSYHVFFFPFKWEYKDRKKNRLEEQTDLQGLTSLLEGQSSNWEKQAAWYPPKTLVQYNEASYFYDFVRTALYDNDVQDAILRHYRYKLPSDASYSLTVKSTGKTYRLRMDDILLHLYNTGVGVLSFHLYNEDPAQSQPDDILRINQYGRRLYPPFFATQPEKIGQSEFFEDQDWARGLAGVKNFELPAKISLEKNGTPFAIETFDVLSIPSKIEQLPRHVTQLFHREIWSEIKLLPVLDDRMFVLCWYGNDELIARIKDRTTTSSEPGKPNYRYYCDDWWYKFIFVDGENKTCQNEEMTIDLLRQHTNARWANAGTLYGVSRYSFVCLTNEINEPDAIARIIASHIQTMYYKMVELSLVQRACLLRFSDEVTEVSKLKPAKELAGRVSSLFKEYIRFVNKIYFREVTAQEQGIELYDLLQKHMRLDSQVKDLEKEIEELHQYVMMMEENKRNNNLETLTLLGAFFLVPTFVVGYFGMNVFRENKPAQEILDYSWVVACCAVLVLLTLAALKSKGFWRSMWIVLFLLILAATLCFLPKLYFQ